MIRQLYIMVKEPRPGRVKTRLGQDMGQVRAAWWFRHQTRTLIRRLSGDPRWQTVLAVTPDIEGLNSRVWPENVARIGQGQGDLGDRMARILRGAPVGPVLIIGADIPAIRSVHIEQAFRALGHHDAVIGPAPDGGYWLIGLKNTRAVPRGLFDAVRWSSEHARADTLVTMKGLRCAMVQTLRDVDTVQDLRFCHRP